MKPRYWWALAVAGAAAAAALAASLLPAPQAARVATAETTGERGPDACIDTTYEGLGGIDVVGPIAIQSDRARPRSGEERSYRKDIRKLVEAHNATAQGTRYVLTMSPGLAVLCERDEPKKCRVRHLRTQRTLEPSMAAQMLFQDTVRAQARLQACRFGEQYL